MPKKPRFEIVVGSSTKSPELAAKDAEKKAAKAGGEQISIAASALGGTTSAVQNQMLDNIAKNIYQLVQCSCLKTVGKEIKTPGVPPPIPFAPITPTGGGGGVLWVVYILLRH